MANYFSDIDESQSQPKQSKSDYFSDLSEQPSRMQSILSALPKGLIKGAASFSPLPNFGPISNKLGEKITEQILPTNKGGIEDVLEFTGQHAPAAALGEGGLVKKGLQAIGGGLGKKLGKELELPEWAQDLLGGLGMAVPGIAKAAGSKGLRASAKQKNMVDFLKSEGLSDKSITPLIQNEKKLSWLSKGAAKFEKKDPWLKAIKDDLGTIFEDVREQGRGKYLQGPDLLAFDDAFHAKLQKVPRMYRGLVQKEIEDLMNNPIDFTELHDFQKAINAIVKNVQGGKAALGILKEPLEKAQKSLNPQLYDRLQSLNKSYSSLQNFTDKMTKKNWEGLLKLGQAGGALLGVLTWNPLLLKGAGLSFLGRIGLKQVLTNPRLQNIHSKMWDAFLKNKMPTALKLLDLFNKEVKNSQEEAVL
jgi:hypothetical protein